MRHHRKAEHFFTKDETERIKNATREVELGTIGEIAVVVVDQSSHYREAEMLGGVFSGSLNSLIISAVFFHASLWFYVPLSFLLFFPVRLIFQRVPRLKEVFVGRKRRELAVRERALKAFYENGLYKTRQNTGVLFFISLLERKVWVLADKGIHEKIRQQTLNRFADMVSKGIRGGRACDALCEAIREAGEALAKHYPVTPGDVDELPDGVICEPDGECDT
jgi:putative membrane protein